MTELIAISALRPNPSPHVRKYKASALSVDFEVYYSRIFIHKGKLCFVLQNSKKTWAANTESLASDSSFTRGTVNTIQFLTLSVVWFGCELM